MQPCGGQSGSWARSTVAHACRRNAVWLRGLGGIRQACVGHVQCLGGAVWGCWGHLGGRAAWHGLGGGYGVVAVLQANFGTWPMAGQQDPEFPAHRCSGAAGVQPNQIVPPMSSSSARNAEFWHLLLRNTFRNTSLLRSKKDCFCLLRSTFWAVLWCSGALWGAL